MQIYNLDVLVVGSGLSGFTTALCLTEKSQKVALVCKQDIQSGASWLAQGGIVAVLNSQPDDIFKHVSDTLVAGCFLNNTEVVKAYSEKSHDSYAWLAEKGVPFTKEDKELHLTKEGGHTQRRILHVADHTGFSIQSCLSEHVKESAILLLENCTLLELIVQNNRCLGAYLLDTQNNELLCVLAGNTVIATGGVGQVFERTVSPATITGDGLRACWSVGCDIGNMEFIQFHPTGLYMPGFPDFLISEAVRGEGGLLLNNQGKRFMPDYDDRLELAPRDVVARSILSEMIKTNHPCVYLQIHHMGADFVKHHFPLIHSTCLERGLDITLNAIPVAPITHYTCGGVNVDSTGATSVDNLYCVGEVANTGFHGANRLASNSLLECVVDGQKTANAILTAPSVTNSTITSISVKEFKLNEPSVDLSKVNAAKQELKQLMWINAGLLRTSTGLSNALLQLEKLAQDWSFAKEVAQEPVQELISLITCAKLICEFALSRENSIGCHFRVDFPSAPKQPIAASLKKE